VCARESTRDPRLGHVVRSRWLSRPPTGSRGTRERVGARAARPGRVASHGWPPVHRVLVRPWFGKIIV
jgi:hypothetical protein